MNTSMVTWTLEGVDAGDFTINAMTGVVSMVARNFEMPEDADTMNDYEITVRVTDADQNTQMLAITVTVDDVREVAALAITGIVDAMVAENSLYPSPQPELTTGDDPIGVVTWTLEGVDAGAFTINAMTGMFSMTPRNFEAPEDADMMNDYEVTVRATDADENTATVAITVTVEDVVETADLLISDFDDATKTVNENDAYVSPQPSLSTGDTPIGVVAWTLEGFDAGAFTINAMTGVVSMVARNFEMPKTPTR